MTDPIEAYLRRSPLTNRQRAELWDAYEGAADEDALESAIRAMKVPNVVKAGLWDLKAGVAKDVPTAEATPPTAMERVQDFTAGAVKGAGQTLMRTVGPMALGPLGVAAAGLQDGYVRTPDVLEPNDAQRLGHTVEQVGEFLAPGGATARAGKAFGAGRKALAARAGLEAAVSGGLASEQTGGDPTAVGVSAAAGAAGHLTAKLAEVAGGGLRKLAETQYGRALAATGKRMKEESRRIIPKLLDQRVSGSLEGLAERGAAESGEAGKAIARTYEAASNAGTKSRTAPILRELEAVKGRFYATSDAGQAIPVNPVAIAKVEAMQELIGQFGDTVRPDQLWALRKSIDDIIKGGGGFGAEVSPATTKALQREARTAIQRELSKASPDIAVLNAEFSLWKGLENVAKATVERKTGQSGIVEFGIRTGVGGATGLLLGQDPQWASAGALLGAITKSPRYRTMSAVEKARLAHALSKGQTETALSILSRVAAGVSTSRTSSSRPSGPDGSPRP